MNKENIKEIKLQQLIREILSEKKKYKKKKKKKRDRCLRIADRKYDEPSAYKSGAVVRCRIGDIWKDLKEENLNTIYSDVLTQTEKEALELVDKNWDKFGGEECNNGFCDIFAQKLSKYLPGSKIMSTEDNRSDTFGHVWIEYKGKYFDAETPNGVSSWKELPWMVKFYNKNKEYPTDIEYLNETADPQSGKAAPYGSGYSVVKELILKTIQEDESLYKWFKRSGPKGKEGGWIDCNAPDGEGGYKACGRKKGEKRSEYPACKPTAAKCKAKGKGTKWGKTK